MFMMLSVLVIGKFTVGSTHALLLVLLTAVTQRCVDMQ
jgi:hypothetical protein